MTLATHLKLFIYLENMLLFAETFGAYPLRRSIEMMSAEVSVPMRQGSHVIANARLSKAKRCG